MSGGIYSDLKPAWWYVHDGGMPKAPKQAQVILSDLCNQNCHFCAYRMDGYSSNEMFMGDSKPAAFGHNNPKRWVDTDRALALMQELKDAGVLAVQFTGGGEPTVHPDHERIFQHALSLGLKCALVTNGMHMNDSLISMLTEFQWVRVSLDAGTPETYSKTRDTGVKNFHRVLDNVTRLAHSIEMEQWSPCVLGIGYVVTPDNYREIDLGVDLAKRSGAAYIRMSAMFNPDGALPYAGIYDAVKTAIHQARAAHETETFKVHDLFGDRIEDLEQGAPDYPVCYYQHMNTFIGGDLNVYRCCTTSYSKHGLLGNIKDEKYGDWLAKPETQEKLKNFNATSCKLCQFNQRNRTMNYLLGPKPPHVEFP